MPNFDIAHQRLFNQSISQPSLKHAADVVQYLVAVQSQDYGGAKWALGLRSRGLADADIEQAFHAGEFLRTHVLRPTWHFVSPADIRWMLALTASRIHAANALMYRKLELDDALFARTTAVLEQALRDGQHLTRSELGAILQQAGIATDNRLRLAYIMMHAELEGIVCSGARRGKQQTYALLDERAPQARLLNRDEALGELSRRYFLSRGPATVRDYGNWSGLTLSEAKAGLDMVKSELVQETVDGQTYWRAAAEPAQQQPSPSAYLLPNYDEYVSGYADRSAVFDLPSMPPTLKTNDRDNVLFANTVVLDGQIIGRWKRTLTKQSVTVEVAPMVPLTDNERQAVVDAAERYGNFLQISVVLAQQSS